MLRPVSDREIDLRVLIGPGTAQSQVLLSRSRFEGTKSGARDLNPGPHGPEPVSVPCPPVSDRLRRRPREYEIDQPRVLW